MKPIKSQSLIGALILFAFLVGTALFFAGCGTTNGERKPLLTLTPQSLENKAYAVTLGVGTKVLQNNPKLRDEFTEARRDLNVIAENEGFGIVELQEVISRLKVDGIKDGDLALAIELGTVFFSDEVGAVAVNNPEQVQVVARGMVRALDKVLAQ